MNLPKTFIGALIAGVLIGFGCIVNSMLGGIIGALLFATGLVTIIHFKFPLFTGIVADKISQEYFINTFITLIGNLIGAVLVQTMYTPEISMPNVSFIHTFILSIGTGVLMVAAYKSKQYIIAIMGVALFISCGWFHCIAEACYGRMNLLHWFMCFCGNIVGGQLFRTYDWCANYNENNNK